MSKLGEEVSEFKRKLIRINDNERNEDIIEKTGIIARELSKITESLEDQVQFLNAIKFINKRYENSRSYNEIFQNNQEYHAYLGTLEFRKKFSLRLETIISKFNIFNNDWERLEYKVQQQESYTDTRDSLKSIVETLKQNNTSHWENWLKILDADIKIEDEFLEKQRHNPSQKANYDDFHEKQSRYKTKLKERDKSSQLAQDIQRLATELADIKANFDLSDFPKDVEKFFKSVDNRFETATLEYLTPEVLEWITEHNYLKNFKVERKH
ncbi:hypothetical protein [Alteromonas sp. RKMC-009]|uniref:hypothetical protein n=1 Tax=Alteromonas sp. RKMC-009 TaxID=2267264 RepID=UPI000E687C52|nr:hypothetical protein [Alteromonas sp. RKMC-009]AYA62598.1 hypothetical protein DS731_00455 [Alteromonas sp. RKMC-009]